MNLSVLTVLGVLLAVTAISWRRGARAVAIGAAIAALLPAWTLIRTTHPVLLAVLVVLVAGLVWHRWGRTMATVIRWGASSRRKAGVASSVDIARVSLAPGTGHVT